MSDKKCDDLFDKFIKKFRPPDQDNIIYDQDNIIYDLCNLNYIINRDNRRNFIASLFKNLSYYCITYTLIFTAILTNSIELFIGGMLISPYAKHIKQLIFNILVIGFEHITNPIISDLFFLILIPIIFFLISILFGYILNKSGISDIENSFHYTDKINKNKNIRMYIISAAIISFAVCFYSSNTENNLELVGLGICITLLPALIISGYNYGRYLKYKKNSNNPNISKYKLISYGGLILYFINLFFLIFWLLIFYSIFNEYKKWKSMRNLFLQPVSQSKKLKKINDTIDSKIKTEIINTIDSKINTEINDTIDSKIKTEIIDTIDHILGNKRLYSTMIQKSTV